MAYSFDVDHDKKLVDGKLYDTVTGAELIELVTELVQLEQQIAGYNEFWDCSGVSEADVDYNKMMTMTNIESSSRQGLPAKNALLVKNNLQMGLARMYQTLMSDSNMDIRIFTDAQKARQWLGISQ